MGWTPRQLSEIPTARWVGENLLQRIRGELPAARVLVILIEMVLLATARPLATELLREPRYSCTYEFAPFGLESARFQRTSDTSSVEPRVRVFPGPDGLVNADVAHLYTVEEFAFVTSTGPHSTPMEHGWVFENPIESATR